MNVEGKREWLKNVNYIKIKSHTKKEKRIAEVVFNYMPWSVINHL